MSTSVMGWAKSTLGAVAFRRSVARALRAGDRARPRSALMRLALGLVDAAEVVRWARRVVREGA